MVISLGGTLRPCRLPRHLGSGSRLSTGSASHLPRMVAHTLRSFRRLLQGGLPFSLRQACHLPALVSVALALRRERQSGLSGPATGPSHAFTWHPALCSSDFPLSCDSDHPAPPILPNPLSPIHMLTFPVLKQEANSCFKA